MDDNGIILESANVKYRSQNDEAAFFEWLDKIKCIAGYYGSGSVLYIKIFSNEVDDQSLREILAIFYRYEIDMKQLAIFKNKKNQKWFYESHKYWFKRVFSSEEV